MFIADKVHELGLDLLVPLQMEVLRFVEALVAKTQSAEKGELRPFALAAGEFVVCDDFDDPMWFEFSVSQAMRGMEDEDEPIYKVDDLKETFQ